MKKILNKVNEKKKIWFISILIGVCVTLAMLILELILFFTCRDNLLCLGLLIIPTLPGIVLSKILHLTLERYSLVFFNLAIWFLLGSIIGFLVFKRKQKKRK